jgi:16S rRNA (guanine527-N7)-methyltransferase
MTLAQQLADGIRQLDLALSDDQQTRLLDYLALMKKWNKVHNLTAVREPEAMVTLHLLDSLAVLPHIGQGRLLDVGSGGGLPGIPLAIARPDLAVTVMDSNHKKASFMRQAKATLALTNLEVVCGRVEEYRPESLYDMIISRAFSEIAEFVRLTRHLLAPGGRWLAMKGVYPHGELTAVPDVSSEVVALNVPGLEAQRHIVFLKAA